MVRTRGEFAREQDERKLVVGDNCREFIEQYDLVHPFLGDRDSEELEEKWEKGSVQVMSNNYFSKSFSFLSFLFSPSSPTLLLYQVEKRNIILQLSNCNS